MPFAWPKKDVFVIRDSFGSGVKIKKHSRTSPDVQIKKFSLTKQKTRPGMNYEWIGKTI